MYKTKILNLLFCISSVLLIINYSDNSFSQTNNFIRLKDVPPSFNRSSIVFSPDSNKIIITAGMIGEEGKDATVWDTNTGEVLFHLDHTEMITGNYLGQPIGRGYVDSADFSDDGKYIVTGAAPLIAIIWDAQTGKPIHTFQLDKEGLKMPSQTAFTAVGFTSDRKQLITSAILPETHLWDVEEGEYLRLLFSRGGIEKIGTFRNSNRIFSMSESTVSVYDYNTGEVIFREYGLAPTLSDDELFFYLHLGKQGIYKINALTGNLDSVNINAPFPDESIEKMPPINISPNGKFTIIGKQNNFMGSTNLYSLESKSDLPLRTFESPVASTGEESEPELIEFSPDSKKVAIRYPGNVVIIHDISDLTSNIPEAPIHK